MKKFLIVALSVLIFSQGASLALAVEPTKEPQAVAIAFDVLILRPLGFVSVILGSGLYILSLPFSIPTNSSQVVKKKLVQEPMRFTFNRPVGEFSEH